MRSHEPLAQPVTQLCSAVTGEHLLWYLTDLYAHFADHNAILDVFMLFLSLGEQTSVIGF